MNNVTGGILLFTLGALIIAMGVTEKGRQVFSIVTGKETTTTKEKYPETGLGQGKEKLIDSPVEESSNMFGFSGEKGASYVG